MKNKFKTRLVLLSRQQLVLAFTFAMSFFYNTMMAQVSVDLDLAILQGETGANFIIGDMPSPKQTSPSYTINVVVTDFPSNVDGITINFGNGQSQFINLSGVAKPVHATCSVSYYDSDTKTISATEVLWQNNQTAATWSRLLMRFPHRAVESSYYQTPDETVDISGINMHIKYASSNTQHKLKKPLIFLEGIDFSKEIVYDVTGKPVRVGSFGWDTFVTGMVDNPSDSDNETFALLPQFVNQMLSEGYDIVFCDFQNGTDNIETNGRGLIAVINEVNSRKKSGLTSKQSCYANIVVGASMGGQVARWALRTMENEGTDHDCSLYYSMDSPHKGANIPLAMQAFIWFGANYGPESATKRQMSILWESLNSPAAKQLLAFHLGTNGEHPAYISMMNQLGYPQRTRNIASANGSRNGQNQGYANNGLLMYAKANVNIFSAGQFTVFETMLNAGGANLIARLDRVFEKPTLSNRLNISTGHMSLVRQSNNSVVLSGGEVYMPLIGLNTPINIPTVRTITFDKDMTMWDNCSGGNRNDIASGLLPSIVDGLKDYWNNSQGPSGKQCFIPTVSALDLVTNDMNTPAEAFIGVLTNPPANKTPFKSVFISAGNEAHVFMSPELLIYSHNEIVANTKISCSAMAEGPIKVPIDNDLGGN